MPRMHPLLRAALDYAESGYAVFPCGKDKTPRTKAGFHEATTDEAEVRRMFAEPQDLTIGVAVPDGFIIIDTDPRNGGDDTIKALRREHGRGAFLRTLTARTGSGGTHWWYSIDESETRLRGKLGDGVDVKRPGKGYVIMPPSRSESGAYVWENELDVKPAPDWMLDALRRPERTAADNGLGNHPSNPAAMFPFADGTAYGERAMALEIEQLLEARPGERNDALNRAAFSLAQLVAGGELKEEPVREQLWAAAVEMGLEEHETELTITSGIDAGLQEPRNAPEQADRTEGLGGSAASLVELEGAENAENADGHYWLEWDGEVEADEYILEPVIPRNAYVLVYGPTEASKSMVFNALGAEASRRGYSVSVYSLENPPNVDRQRVRRLEPDGGSFRLTNELTNLADPRQAVAMMERERGRDLVIIDTYSHAFAQRYDSGDGNAKAIEFARVVRWLMRRTGATFVVIDHTGFERLDEPRDASAKRQQVDVAIGMEKIGMWERGRPARFKMTNFKSARFANPFSFQGRIVGNGDEPLKLEWDGSANRELVWGSE